LEFLGRKVSNDGIPQEEEIYKKVFVEILMKGLWGVPMEHH
jgi:hypothetical protein